MRPFETLTPRGQARRLRRVALAALEQFDLEVTRVALLAHATNMLFRVRTEGGSSYVLRVCAPEWRDDVDLQSEAMWLAALARESDIGAPVPIPARTAGPLGPYVVVADAKGVRPLRCVLMSWIPGTPLGRLLSEGNLVKMGELFARMHAHGAAFVPPLGFTTRRLGSFLARGEPNVLFSDPCMAEIAPEDREVLLRTRERVDAAHATLYAQPDGLRVIHSDLWHDNIKVDRGRLRPLDFEDTVWGYPVQDIAPALQDLMVDVAPDRYEPYVAAFRAGYEALAPWPERYEGEIDVYRAGRVLWVCNYVARFEREYLASHTARMATLLRQFLETGQLRKVTATPGIS